jgi:hypothetical protein
MEVGRWVLAADVHVDRDAIETRDPRHPSTVPTAYDSDTRRLPPWFRERRPRPKVVQIERCASVLNQSSDQRELVTNTAKQRAMKSQVAEDLGAYPLISEATTTRSGASADSPPSPALERMTRVRQMCDSQRDSRKSTHAAVACGSRPRGVLRLSVVCARLVG